MELKFAQEYIHYLFNVNFPDNKFSILKIIYFYIIISILCALNTPITIETGITIFLAFVFHVFVYKFIANTFKEKE